MFIVLLLFCENNAQTPIVLLLLFDKQVLLLFDKQCLNKSLCYCYCFTNNAQMHIVLLLLFDLSWICPGFLIFGFFLRFVMEFWPLSWICLGF